MKQIFLELTLGHRALVRDKPTPEGYTHDWEVFIRHDQGPIQLFVEKVIFHLHESFPKPRRVLKDPPFIVKESGYAGFIVKMEVFFKNKEDPRKAEFEYDLFLMNGQPVNNKRKEKLIFNYPSPEFAKKLLKGGGVYYEEKKSRGGDPPAASSPAYIATNTTGGKPAKHSSTTSTRSSPKSSFEHLFGTPIKRGSASVTTASVPPLANPNNPKSGKSGKSDKADKIFGDDGGKGDKSSKGDKNGKSPIGSPGSSASPSSSKSSRSSTGKKSSKEEDKLKKMLPPENSAVPKKAKKSSEIFDRLQATSGKVKGASKGSKKKSKAHKVKTEPPDSNPSTPDEVTVKHEPSEVKSERLSPLSSGSRSRSPSASPASAHLALSEEDERQPDSEEEEVVKTKRIAAATSSSRRRTRRSRSDSDSGNEGSPIPSPAQISPASSSSGDGTVSPKRRKTSTSSSSLTPDHNTFHEKPNSSSSVKVKKERHQKREKKSRKPRKKSKKHKEEKQKVFAESSDPSSSEAEVESYASPDGANGISSNTNGLSPSEAFNHGNNSNSSPSGITAEMKSLQDLHAQIARLADPEKLQEVVDIVESCGRDLWTIESGLTFDFDLCKLSAVTIKKLHEIFD